MKYQYSGFTGKNLSRLITERVTDSIALSYFLKMHRLSIGTEALEYQFGNGLVSNCVCLKDQWSPAETFAAFS